MSGIYPVKIEPVSTELKKSIGWAATGYAVGALFAGPLGGLVGAVSQGNEPYITLSVTFSNGGQKLLKVHKNKLALELLIWTWRIENRKTENDYITFGLDFSSLTWEQVVPLDVIYKYLDLDEELTDFGEAWQKLQLEIGLRETLKKEIQRYFLEQKNLKITVWDSKKGLIIPSKNNRNPGRPIGWIESIFMIILFIGMVFLNVQCENSSSRTDYQPQTSEQE